MYCALFWSCVLNLENIIARALDFLSIGRPNSRSLARQPDRALAPISLSLSLSTPFSLCLSLCGHFLCMRCRVIGVYVRIIHILKLTQKPERINKATWSDSVFCGFRMRPMIYFVCTICMHVCCIYNWPHFTFALLRTSACPVIFN